MFSYFKKRKRFNKIIADIKAVNIQGARNVARAALEAYTLLPNPRSRKKLLAARPTEPMMHHVLDLASRLPKEKILAHFDEAQEAINGFTLSLFPKRKKVVVMTHCHSTNVVGTLLHAKANNRVIRVRNLETRPLYQGRKTAKDLAKQNIPVTTYVDSAMRLALLGESKKEGRASFVLLGADALTDEGVINKIGSAAIAELASSHRIPVYIVADSWKYTKRSLPIEKRPLNEVWNAAPRHVKINNPAFEFVPKRYITGIITEHTKESYDKFVKEMHSLRA